MCLGCFAWSRRKSRCLLGTYCNAGQRSPPFNSCCNDSFQFRTPGGGGSFKAAVSVLGHPVVGITLPSGILMSVLCCQTASSTFPPHIFPSLLLFCSLCHPKPIPPLSSLALSTAVHSNTHRQMRPPPHTHIF